MKQQPYWFKYALIAVAVFVVWRVAKKSSTSGGDGAAVGCVSSTDDSVIRKSATTLRQIFQNSWYYDQSDYTAIINAWKDFEDACGVRKLYAYFGTASTYLYGHGNLDYWMSKLPANVRATCSAHGYGVTDF